MQQFKALVTFAHGDNSFFPSGEINEAPAELVKEWAAVGYAEVVEKKKETITQGEPAKSVEIEKPKATSKKKGAVK